MAPSLIYTFIACAILIPLSGVALFVYYSTHLPNFKPLKEQPTNAYSIVYSEEDEVVGKFLLENRIPIPYEQIPRPLIQAFVAAEDCRLLST